MGWSGATGIFDGVVRVAARYAAPGTPIAQVVRAVYTEVDWDDWDTQDESDYAEYLTPLRVELGEIDPEDLD